MKKERGILFKTPMVRAILANRKIMTRRIITSDHITDKDVYKGIASNISYLQNVTFVKDRGEVSHDATHVFDRGDVSIALFCPYGKRGDILWVRETYFQTETGYIYKSDLTSDEIHKFHHSGNKWKPSRFMPKVASRIWLEIEDVTVERLYDISYDDAIAEGFGKPGSDYPEGRFFTYVTDMYGYHFVNSNPWVWVIKFKVLSTTGKSENLNAI